MFCDWNGDAENAFVAPIPVAPVLVGNSCRVGSLLGPGTKGEADPGLGKGL